MIGYAGIFSGSYKQARVRVLRIFQWIKRNQWMH